MTLALARKWRPRDFAGIIGQEHVVKTLSHALEHDRLHHAYLFTGTRGVGKTTLARILAKSLSCQKGISKSPCQTCQTCQDIDKGRFLDLIEVDAASRTKVEDTRDLMDNTQFAPSSGPYKIYLIDEVHMLSNHSFNALLKTLEEPPEHVKFLLATTEAHKIPMTILSRCIQFHLKSIPLQTLIQYFAKVLQSENIGFEEHALQLIAQAANGSVRDGLSLLDQAISFGEGEVKEAPITELLGVVDTNLLSALFENIADGRIQDTIAVCRQLSEIHADFGQCLEKLLHGFHLLSAYQLADVAIPDDELLKPILDKISTKLSPERLTLLYQFGLMARKELSLAPSPQMGFEMSILRMMAFNPDHSSHSANNNPETVPASENVKKKSQASDTHLNASTKAPQKAKKIEHSKTPTSSSSKPLAWEQAQTHLKLQGASAIIANHCMLKSFIDSKVTLTLDPDKSNILTPKIEERIAKQLSLHLNTQIHLAIEVGHEKSTETPAAKAAALKASQQKKARDTLSSDPQVSAIMKDLNAEIIDAAFVEKHEETL